MSNGDHAEKIGALSARDDSHDQSLRRIEFKVDRIQDQLADVRVKVAGWSSIIAAVVSAAVMAVGRAL